MTQPFGSFFLPGPTDVRHELLAAMTRPMIPHRGAAFEAMFARITTGLQTVFGTTRPIYVSSSSATGLMEAGMRAAPAGPVLNLVNGAFSGRYHEISAACGRETEVIDVEWGEAVPLERIEARLKARHFGALTVAQSETTTGVLQDVRAIRALCAAHDTACLVDSVTGIGGAEFHFDAWEMDYALTGSQKAMALPPGLAFAAASPAFIAGAAAQPARGLYFDLLEHDEYARKNQTPNTPAVSLFFALEQQLADIQRETMPARWARHLAMRDLVHGWVAQTGATFGVGILARPEVRGPTVTVLTIPERIGTAPLLAALSARGITLGSGYGKLAKTTVRLGHMGDHTVATVQRALDALTESLEALTGR